jgi:hypothetical protein
LLGYATAIERARISAKDRARCAGVVVEWLERNARGVGEDLMFAARYAVRPLKRRVLHAPRPARRHTDGARV